MTFPYPILLILRLVGLTIMIYLDVCLLYTMLSAVSLTVDMTSDG